MVVDETGPSAVENVREENRQMMYTSRGLRWRGETDKWEVRLSHKDPLTGDPTATYYTVEGKTQRQAERAFRELGLRRR